MTYHDPFSRPPLAGSASEEQWVKSNASLFSATAAWFFLKAVLFLVVTLVAVAFLLAFFGSSVATVFVVVLVAALLVVGLRRQRRKRARVAALVRKANVSRIRVRMSGARGNGARHLSTTPSTTPPRVGSVATLHPASSLMSKQSRVASVFVPTAQRSFRSRAHTAAAMLPRRGGRP